MYFANQDSWNDPSLNVFIRSIIKIENTLQNSIIIINGSKIHTKDIAVTFEIDDSYNLIIENFEYDSIQSLS